ncbi:CPBP family intramembrane glutamic endopeptidase [Seonamhaeicola sp. S2-3]|uniref:CPBP family intramembrane glutamic endopeptidase n=1 Tax=Seonamhaeicola sp. S2-3 TaxID=1936081 RepID=UPI001E5CBC20|nr:type II CAAX endopeptidase family protein [Seonamhaeicola sp. S2-3]
MEEIDSHKTEKPLNIIFRLILFAISYFFIVGIFQFIGFLVSNVDLNNLDALKTTEQHLIISLFDFVGNFLLLWLFMKYVDKEKFIKLGFSIQNKIKEIILGILLGVLIMGLGFLTLLMLNEISFYEFNYNFKEIMYSILVYIIVAFVEEAIFRGYILRNLMMSSNSHLALVISSILFALAHGFNPNMDWFSYLDLFLAGILLGISYVYTRNLWFPIALHFSWNFFQTLLGFNVSGQDFYSLIEFKIEEKNILNGGDFGFEGSIFSILIQVLLIVVIFLYYERIKSKKLQN